MTTNHTLRYWIQKISKYVALGFVIACCHMAVADVPVTIVDDFEDGNFTSNPTWTVTAGTLVVANDPDGSEAVRSTNAPYGLALALDDIAVDSSVNVSIDWRRVNGNANAQIVSIDLINSQTGEGYAFAASPNTTFGPTGQRTGLAILELGSTGSQLGAVGETLIPNSNAYVTLNAIYDPINDSLSFTINQGTPSEVTLNTTDFVNPGTLDTLRVRGANVTVDHFFDNVSVSYTAIPEPGSLGFLGISGLLLLAKRGKRACH